ncbi:LysR family transcriptional regulator [Lysinibacillus agricola]|uniref:LysR family transcriptional regulator n=1 Tax=Lysinibacillus agricola TaxID=2590012 RepID=A0ABX7AX13_9BACI|nr:MULTISPECIES: LysR family transcriptional regulator [Lysinibacillus]KOS60215.1 transcriptional regulator [Lysinibacillus sp. FJAT-14222]QQP14505.1 LysR family transcriptional regulator [Lysinibacillus agricola]
MNLHALRIFHIVAEKGSVTQAANEINISQPAVTAQVKKLEQEIGLSLLAPKGRGVFLTESGRQLTKYTKKLFTLEEEIEKYIEQFKKGLVGKLSISATYLPANFLLPKWLADFKQKFPDIEVELTSTNSSKAINQLINYEADIAFIGGINESHPLIYWKELFKDEMWFVVSRNHKFAKKKVTLAETMLEPFVFREEGSSSREKLVSLCKINNINQPSIGLQMNGLNETIRAVMEGYGITFVSSLEAKEYIARGDLAKIDVEDIRIVNPISICTRKDDELSSPALNFVESIMEKDNSCT